MLERLNEVEKRFEAIESDLLDPAVMSDIEKYTALLKERANLEPVGEKFREYKMPEAKAEGAREILETEDDPEMREMADNILGEELAYLRHQAKDAQQVLQIVHHVLLLDSCGYIDSLLLLVGATDLFLCKRNQLVQRALPHRFHSYEWHENYDSLPNQKTYFQSLHWDSTNNTVYTVQHIQKLVF